MFDIGWAELLVVGVVALVVIGPKDLPRMAVTAGRYARRVRAMGQDFISGVAGMADEIEAQDKAKRLEKPPPTTE